MPCFIGCLALAMPRVALFCVWLFSGLLERNYSSIFWPLAGFIFAPLTTLVYAYAHQESGGPPHGVWLVLVVVAVLADLGLLRGGSGMRKKNQQA